MRTVMPNIFKAPQNTSEAGEVVDLGWVIARFSYEVGFINVNGGFVTWQEPPNGEEVIRRLQNVQFFCGPDEAIPAQAIFCHDIQGLVRLRDALNQALPLPKMDYKIPSVRVVTTILRDLKTSTWAENHPEALKDLEQYAVDMALTAEQVLGEPEEG